MIKAVVFDFGGVVANEGFQEWIAKNIGSYKEIESDIAELEKKVNKGDLLASAYDEELAKRSGKTPANVQREVLSGYMMRTDMIDIVLLLKKNNIKSAILSNFPKAWFDVLRNNFQLDAIFNPILISSEMHLIKPDKEIFEKMLAVISVKPEDVIFVDDKESNVIAADKVGIHGILFTSPEKLKNDLEKFGIDL